MLQIKNKIKKYKSKEISIESMMICKLHLILFSFFFAVNKMISVVQMISIKMKFKIIKHKRKICRKMGWHQHAKENL